MKDLVQSGEAVEIDFGEDEDEQEHEDVEIDYDEDEYNQNLMNIPDM